MTENVSGIDKLENLPLSQLFSGPLLAAVDASVQSQQATVDLLLQSGFDDDGNLVTVSFEYQEPATNPETGEPGTTTSRIEIPLLLFLTLPNLQISRIEEEFSAQITGIEETEGGGSTESAPAVGALGASTLSTPMRLRVKPSGQSKQYERTVRSRFDLSVTMVAEIRNESTGMDLLERAVSNASVANEGESTDRTRITPRNPNREGASPE